MHCFLLQLRETAVLNESLDESTGKYMQTKEGGLQHEALEVTLKLYNWATTLTACLVRRRTVKVMYILYNGEGNSAPVLCSWW